MTEMATATFESNLTFSLVSNRVFSYHLPARDAQTNKPRSMTAGSRSVSYIFSEVLNIENRI